MILVCNQCGAELKPVHRVMDLLTCEWTFMVEPCECVTDKETVGVRMVRELRRELRRGKT